MRPIALVATRTTAGAPQKRGYTATVDCRANARFIYFNYESFPGIKMSQYHGGIIRLPKLLNATTN